jgi:hypothetical protein
MYSTLLIVAFYLSVSQCAVMRGRQAPAAASPELQSPDLPLPDGSIGAAASAILAGAAPSPVANPEGSLTAHFVLNNQITSLKFKVPALLQQTPKVSQVFHIH